jgi:uroporphyrinogen decarboxylase
MSSIPNSPRFLAALARQPVDRPPAWLMRQAGRYLPEYRAVRETTGGFLGLVRDPAQACEVTLQPIRRFGFDASIIFSDILVVPEAMGMELSFGVGEGPKLAPPIRDAQGVARLSTFDPKDKVPFLLEAIRRVVDGLPAASKLAGDQGQGDGGDVPLIGFAGAPFTVSCYAVEGEGSKHFVEVKKLMGSAPEVFHALLDKFVAGTIPYLQAQVEAGCRVLQIFDTWAGELSPDDLTRFAVEPVKRIIAGLRAAGVTVPIIYFARGCGESLDLVKGAGADAYGLDWRSRLARARRDLGPDVAVQGNLDPAALFSPPDVVAARTRRVLADAGSAPGYIFNLGHGILPGTPIESVHAALDVLRGVVPAGAVR